MLDSVRACLALRLGSRLPILYIPYVLRRRLRTFLDIHPDGRVEQVIVGPSLFRDAQGNLQYPTHQEWETCSDGEMGPVHICWNVFADGHRERYD